MGADHLIEKTQGTEFTQIAEAFFLPVFDILWGAEERSVIVSPGLIW